MSRIDQRDTRVHTLQVHLSGRGIPLVQTLSSGISVDLYMITGCCSNNPSEHSVCPSINTEY